MSIHIQCIATIKAALGECPVWDPEGNQLWFIDSKNGLVYQVDIASGLSTVCEVPAPAGSFALNADGRLVVALKEDIGLYDPQTDALELVAHIEDSHPNLRLNDGEPMPDGSFIVGTMHIFRDEGQPPLGGLYRLRPDSSLIKLESGIGVTNGPCLSPINGRLHVCDSSVRKIHSYAVTVDGALAERRVFIDTEAFNSAPDGCCFDSLGGLWVALVHAGAIARFEPDGTLTHKIDLPLKHPSSLCFGGKNLDEIFVTSISESTRLQADGPLDGAVLRIQGSGMQGIAQPRCRIGM
jgi:L-arabinonolactonase